MGLSIAAGMLLSTFGTKLLVNIAIVLPAIIVLAVYGISSLNATWPRRIMLSAVAPAAVLSFNHYTLVPPRLLGDADNGRGLAMYELAEPELYGDPSGIERIVSHVADSDPALLAIVAGTRDDTSFCALAVDLQFAMPYIPLLLLLPPAERCAPGGGAVWVFSRADALNHPVVHDLLQLACCVEHRKLCNYWNDQVGFILDLLPQVPVRTTSMPLGDNISEIEIHTVAPDAYTDITEYNSDMLWAMRKVNICAMGRMNVEK